MNSLDLYFRVKKSDILHICTYLESFEGMMALRTPNPDKYSDNAILHMMVSPDYKEQFDILIDDLKNKVMIEETEK